MASSLGQSCYLYDPLPTVPWLPPLVYGKCPVDVGVGSFLDLLAITITLDGFRLSATVANVQQFVRILYVVSMPKIVNLPKAGVFLLREIGWARCASWAALGLRLRFGHYLCRFRLRALLYVHVHVLRVHTR